MQNLKITDTYVGFAVLTAVVMKNTILWDIMPCSLLSTLPPTFTLIYFLAYPSALKMEVICSSETLTFNELHGIISQKIALFNPYLITNRGI
jgi:hypothetical protein